MTWYVQGYPNSAGDFSWRVFSRYDLRDDVQLELHVLTPDEFPSQDEALEYMAQEVWSKGIPWLSPFPRWSWSINFDQLRAAVAGAQGLPGWLTGERRSQPSLARSYAFDVEGVPSTDAPSKPLSATNVDTARADGRKVMLSHVVNLAFYETDPFEELEKSILARVQPNEVANQGAPVAGNSLPAELIDSLARFRAEHSERPTAFLMMKFGRTPAHARIVNAIASALDGFGIKVVRADDREYHADLFSNILTYMHGASFGIAVFERLEGDEFNPNVSLEVGYMLGIRKQVCLLKDSTLKGLHTDLVGKLYRDFDPQAPETSIGPKLGAWLRDWEDAIGIKLPE